MPMNALANRAFLTLFGLTAYYHTYIPMEKVTNSVTNIILFAGLASTLISGQAMAAEPTDEMMNVVFIIADDLGWADLGCYGSTFHETPNIDHLATQGMRFTNAYSSHPVCGPARHGIMTGKTPARMKKMPAAAGKIADDEMTWPNVLRDRGYQTFFTGKWHTGKMLSIQRHGFDRVVGANDAGQPGNYFYPFEHPQRTHENVLGLEPGKEGDYLTDRLTDKTVEFLKQVNQEEPFLAYVSYYSPHTPIQAKAEDIAYFEQKLQSMPKPSGPITEPEGYPKGYSNMRTRLVQENPGYASMVRSIDQGVGRILDTLEKEGLSENTIVIFTSDNGGLSTTTRDEDLVTSNYPLRAGKGWLYEGGLRVNLIAKWPGRTAPNSVTDTVTINTDFYPTLLDMLGLPLNPEQHIDGISIKPALLGEEMADDRTLHWVFAMNQRFRTDDAPEPRASIAILKNGYKLLYWTELKRSELYQVKEDIGETTDLSEQMPERLQQLIHEMKQIPNAAEWLEEG